jgi:hypothetical protein
MIPRILKLLSLEGGKAAGISAIIMTGGFAWGPIIATDMGDSFMTPGDQ